MKLKLFPDRTANERRAATKDAFAIFLLFAGVAVVGFGIFALGGAIPPSDNSLWSTIRWGALVLGGIAGWCALQAAFEAMVAATIGPERAIALLAVVGLVGVIVTWAAW